MLIDFQTSPDQFRPVGVSCRGITLLPGRLCVSAPSAPV